MLTSQRPALALQLPDTFHCASHHELATPSRIPSPAELREIVTSAVEHLGPRLTGTRFAISPSVAIGTTRLVLTVSALDSNEAFVVKATTKDLLQHHPAKRQNSNPTFRNEHIQRYTALEEEIPFAGQRYVTVAPLVKGETLLAHATQRGLSEREWDLGFTTVPTLMRTIWREVRSPDDPNLGLLLDHHFDNIIVGVKQPPFHEPSSDPSDARTPTERFVFVDARDDGLYHSEATLESALEDFRMLFKRHAFVRSAWG